ncbi:MAG: hypothetical protein QGF90_05575 [Gammaproteobacteria bacterium]|jgi:hypothetical protein|nr:hypothetical protein [Gammaproteobacteria bacterium]
MRSGFFSVCCIALSCLVPTTGVLGAEFEPTLTPFGHPDFQGNWATHTATPFQRPEELGEKRFYTEAESQEWEREQVAEMEAREAPIEGPIDVPEIKPAVDNTAEDQFKIRITNMLTINGEPRTSILVEPPNGCLPLREGWQANTFTGKLQAQGVNQLDGPEGAGPGARCLIDFGPAPPAGPIVPLSANFQFVQNEDYVILYIEAGAETRFIRLRDEHQNPIHKKWHGDSIGHWEGNTLHVETRNFHPQSSSFVLRVSALLELVEQFTLVSEDEILYRFTYTDPDIYTQSFTGELMLRRMPEGQRLFDYTCHEGNYSPPGILAGARRQEMDATD